MLSENIRLLVIHGPNLNMLGRREPAIYGSATLDDINQRIKEAAAQRGLQVDCLQSNLEGEIVSAIQQAHPSYHGIIINAAAYTHYSIAIRDALASVPLPAIEIHLSNIYKREEFRHHSVISSVVAGQICGFGGDGYLLALEAMVRLLEQEKPKP
ncbi:type II 3-dehydroquinate dehydratase [Azotosporobacter soli]|uniref:type II 3-dehydroquinate dehydratase n=1 Tax=Azotosporobacter soli TaxID=3055040 RepID=UPI0031FEBFB1